MSRSFRQRPIQPNRKMKVYKNGHPLFIQLSFEEQPNLDDSEVQNTSLEKLKKKKKNKNTTATLQHQKKGAVVEIPVPPIVPVADYKHEVSVLPPPIHIARPPNINMCSLFPLAGPFTLTISYASLAFFSFFHCLFRHHTPHTTHVSRSLRIFNRPPLSFDTANPKRTRVRLLALPS